MIGVTFLSLTFAISLAGFACIRFLPAARTPESAVGLPFWFIMVWGPSLAAIILAAQDGHLVDLLQRSVKISTIPLTVWILVVAPLALLAFLRPFASDAPTPISLGFLLSMIIFNAMLGPLGEELGWRGYFQDQLMAHMGWLEASLLVAVIWFIWHLPLWTIETPHSHIALPLFAGHVLCYSIIIGAAYTLSGGSILPAILIHLTVNLSSNLAVFAGFRDPNAWFRASLRLYFALSAFAVGFVFIQTGQTGLRWLKMNLLL